MQDLHPHIWQAHYLALHSRWVILRQTIARCAASGGIRVLDLGCGERPLRSIVAPMQCVSTDIEPLVRPDVVADNAALPFATGSFDLVIASETLEHTERYQEAAAEMTRVTRPGGLIYLSVPFVYPMHGEPFDFQRPTEFGLKALFPSCEVVDLLASNTIYSTWLLALQYAVDSTLHASHRLDLVRGVFDAATNIGALAIDALARVVVEMVISSSSIRRRLEARATHPRKLIGMLESMPAGYVLVVRKP